MKQRQKKRLHILWGAVGALFIGWLWDRLNREHPWVPMCQPSRAHRLLSEYDHRILFGRGSR
jgi:hypothetical protein